MAKQLTFSISGKECTATPMKLDRKKIYGWSEKLALDDDGCECSLVSMDETGTIIIPTGGTGLGILSADGRWVDRKSLKTVKLDGSPAKLMPSSFSVTNVLDKKVTAEELLDCSVTATYHLIADSELIAAIGEDIYTFDYCYRDSYETAAAFLLVANVDGKSELFMLTGPMNDFKFIGFEEISVVDEEVTDEDDDDEIDFSMF